MSRIFISYRRDDSLGHVGWLRHLLSQRFGADQIFRDIEAIPPGVDFVEAIEAAVGSCEVLLAVIGPRWLTTTDRPGLRRLDNPEDFVRIEIATALERNIRVIPVLVQDAHMPRSNELPAALAKLARRNAIELRDSSWEYDVGRLGDALETILQSQPQVNQQQPVESPPQQINGFMSQSSQDMQVTDVPSQPVHQIPALTVRLLVAEKQKDWDTAINVCEQILKLDSNDKFARSKTAEVYYNRGLIPYNRVMFALSVLEFASWGFPFLPSLQKQAQTYTAVARKDFERAAELGHEEAKKKLAELHRPNISSTP